MTGSVSLRKVRVNPGTINGMKTTIDNAGRVVIPKELREALFLNGGDEVEITLADERLELVPAPRPARLRRGPHGLLVADVDVPPMGPEEVRDALERSRR
jgi:AbrB family looped-hinge helix DNA binding protein